MERRRPGGTRCSPPSTASRRARRGDRSGPDRPAVASYMSNGWNFADLFEALAERQPDALAQRHAGRSTTWAEFDRRADGVAAALLAAGVAEQDKVAQYLYNAPEYLESAFGAFKAGLATVNTNYRYTADELVLPVGQRRRRRRRVPRHVQRAHRRAAPPPCRASTRGCGSTTDHGPCPDWATPYEDAATSAPDGPTVAPWGRSGDHLVLLYTGGTTGHAEGRDVAPGRPVRRPRRGQPQAPAARAGPRRGPRRGSPSRARATCRPPR